MSASKDLFMRLQDAIVEVLYENNLEFEDIVENLEVEFEEEFVTGYIDTSGVQMALDLLAEDSRIMFDNRTDQYCLLDY